MSEAATPYVTRDQAAAPPARLLLVMTRGAYESSRLPGSQRPPFEETTGEWRSAMDREMIAAIRAAEAEGYRIVAP